MLEGIGQSKMTQIESDSISPARLTQCIFLKHFFFQDKCFFYLNEFFHFVLL